MLPHHPDARVCAALTRKCARTFALASNFLPGRKQRAAFALYAFCRRADDIVDSGAAHRAVTLARLELGAYRQRLDSALCGAPGDAVLRELLWAIREFSVPPALLTELLQGVARDLTPPEYRTWAEVADYANGVASSVAEMLVHVFGVENERATFSQAAHRARTLGIAMQLTNILRDVGEDARRGRCYLPEDELERFDLARGDVLQRRIDTRAGAWRGFMRFQISRARALYRDGTAGIALLAADSRRCTWICAAGYEAILDAIELNEYDTLSTRARVPRWQQACIVLSAPWAAGALQPQPLPGSPAAF